MSARTVEQAVEACYGHYIASAVKRGRNPQYPYVPVYRFGALPGNAQTTQIQGRAYANRVEAVSCAQRYIDALRATMAAHLTEPRYRALRQQWGVSESVVGSVAA